MRIRVKAVEGSVVFAVQENGMLIRPLRAVGRDGPTAGSPIRPDGEEVIDCVTYRNAIASKDLVLVEEPAPAETAPATPDTETPQ